MSITPSPAPSRASGRPERRARLWALVALAAATLLVAAVGSPAQAATRPPRPTVVLVHGAFSGPSAWDQVAASLAKDGYATAAVALPLTGLAEDVAAVRAALDGIGGSKVLAAHSYGGFVASNAAAGRADVSALVFTAAFVPDAGETIVGLGEGYAPAAFLAPGHLEVDADQLATIAAPYFRDDFAQDLNPKRAAALDAAQTPTSLGILFTPSGPVAWHQVPSWYAVSGADRVIDPALQRFMAARAGATTVTFDDASHAGGFTHYAARFVKLVEQAAA
jgi:pimeloyl-ACP methyl ester carboxylesterase